MQIFCRLLNDQLDEKKEKFTEATNNCIKLADQLEFAKERQEMFQKNDEHLKKVFSHLYICYLQDYL